MSPEQRDLLAAVAGALDTSINAYVLRLIAADVAAGGVELARRADVDPAVVAGIFRQTWEGPTPTGSAPHAKAQHAVAAAAG